MDYVQKNLAASTNQSTEKALDIIELLADRNQPMRLKDIAAALHMNDSTASRFVSALQSSGYVSKDAETAKYRLTYKICRIANKVGNSLVMSEITHPYLTALSQALGESACVSIEQNMRMVYVDVAMGPDKILMSMQRVGNTVPMHCTGNGKLVMLTFTDEMIDRYIEHTGLVKYTRNTITEREELLRELERIRAAGYATDDEESETGVRCVAYPIRNYTGGIIAGLSITGPATRVTYEFIRKNVHHLKDAADRISETLGYGKTP